MCPHPPQRTGVATAEGKTRPQTHGVDSVYLRRHFSSKSLPSTIQRPKARVNYQKMIIDPRYEPGPYTSGTGPEPNPRLGYQARPGRSRSRTWRVRVGQSGSLPSPCSTNPIGAGPATAKTGAGQDVSESDRAGALHTADQGRSRTYDRAIELGSGWAGAGPAAIPVLLRRAGTAVRQEATNKDEGLSPAGPARWAWTRMDS